MVGFPIPHIGFLSTKGFLFVLTSPILLPEFTSEKKLSLKRIPTFGVSGYGVEGYYVTGEIYVYNEKNEIVFLYSDGKRNAIKYDIEKDIHRQIKSSIFICVRGLDTIGLRMGIYLWIIGGTEFVSSMMAGGPEALKNTVLWVQFFFTNKLD